MYQDYFRFNQAPFSIAPDPAFLYLSERHREALAHLMYGLDGEGGFVLVIGEVGTGKTTLVRSLMDQVPEAVDVAFILNPRVSVPELLETLCDELGVHYVSDESLTVKSYIDRLNAHLLKNHALGRSTVVIIDEAQSLSTDVLEQIRLLTNLETNERKLLRIILLGQTELSEVLDRREMRQLAQRITARYHLSALDRDETRAYIAHRLTRAGGSPHLFTRPASREIYRLSGGIPRLINVIADRALLGSYVEAKQRVSAAIVRKAAREVFDKRATSQRWIVSAGLLLLAVGAAWALLDQQPQPSIADAQPPALASMQVATESGHARVAAEPPEEAPAEPFAADDQDTTPSAPTHTAAEPVLLTPPEPTPGKELPKSLTRPAERSTHQTQLDAYAQVFARWQVPGTVNGIPCNHAPTVGLQCLKQTGTWDELLRLDRPVVLELWNDGATPYYGAMLEASSDIALLSIAGTEHSVGRQALDGSWFGTYIVLWQMPPDYNGNLREGSQGAAVTWLRSQLSDFTGSQLNPTMRDTFDSTLRDAVIRFQRQRGLRPDGIVGPATWIELNSVGTQRVPRLQRLG
jgi:general secretion pathway protein A